MAEYRSGEEVALVSGIYKSWKTCIYQKEHGKKMCTVKLGSKGEGPVRNVRLTSIAKIESNATPTPSTSQGGEQTVVLDKQTYENLIKEVENLKLSVDGLQSTLNRFKS